MNLKTWFKGLAVFVASSLVTSVAASSLDPSAFNFSRAGVARLASLAAVIGAKAVYLYMKQSPLPGTNPATDWTKIARIVGLAALLPGIAATSGCYNSWEQSTYATLAAGKAVIDCAVAGYNHFDADIRHACAAHPDDPTFDPAQFYLPQTREAQQAIEKARQVQVACVEAFAGYAVAKVAKDKSATVAEKQAAVAGYLAQLPALLDAVRALLPPQRAKIGLVEDPGLLPQGGTNRGNRSGAAGQPSGSESRSSFVAPAGGTQSTSRSRMLESSMRALAATSNPLPRVTDVFKAVSREGEVQRGQ